MKNPAKSLTVGGIIGALYAALSLLQNLIVPGSASNIIQFRLAEALCTLGQIDEALTVLEDAADLWCAVWALEPDTQMTFRCPALVPLSSQLCRGGICGGGTGLYAWSELEDISCALKGPGFAPLAVEPRFRVLSDRIKEAVRVSPLNRSPKLSE